MLLRKGAQAFGIKTKVFITFALAKARAKGKKNTPEPLRNFSVRKNSYKRESGRRTAESGRRFFFAESGRRKSEGVSRKSEGRRPKAEGGKGKGRNKSLCRSKAREAKVLPTFALAKEKVATKFWIQG